MPTAERDRDKIAVDDVEYRDRDAMREIPGSKWKVGWTVPLSWTSLALLRSIFGDRLEVAGSLSDWAWDEYHSRIEPATNARLLALQETGDCEGDSRLYPLQRTGVAFLDAAGSAILSDHMGMGKTVEAIMALEVTQSYPVLIVAPNSVKRVWEQHYAVWAPHRTVQVISGSAAKRRQQLAARADVTVINWEALHIHSRVGGYGSIALTDAEKTPKELNRPWAAVVADEAHRALKPKAKQTRALWAIAETSRRKYALTGTPIDGAPDSLWALLHFVAPHEWPSKTKFIDRYCLSSWNTFGGMDIIGLRPDTSEELFKLIAPRMLRRPKEWLKLPEKMPPVTRYVEMTPKQKRAYNQLAEDYFADVDGGTLMSFSPLTVAGRLCQIASASVELEGDDVRLCAPSSKVNELVDVLEEMGSEPAVVFAASRQLIELAAARLEDEGITCSKVVGGQSELHRDGEIEDFKAGRTRVILLTFGAGAEGLTLTQASTIIFMQRSWSMIENKQAEERVHRPGQTGHVTVIDFVADGTIEEHQQRAVADKSAQLEAIVRDKESLREVVHAHR